MDIELDRALAAYRETHRAEALNTPALEDRIITSALLRRQSPTALELPAIRAMLSVDRILRTRARSGLAFAITFVLCGVAYGLTDDGRQHLRNFVAWLRPSDPASTAASGVASQSSPLPSSPKSYSDSTPAADEPSTPTHDEPHSRVALEPSPSLAPPEPQRRSTRSLGISTSSREISPTQVAPSEATPSHRELYRKAQRLSRAGQHESALTAWDEYLTRYPHGPLHVEVRFNRVRSLIRLRRYAEARAALQPFARGDHGRYRQEQALSLRRSLASADDTP